MEENIKRIEMILITCAGGIIVGGATVIMTILSLHG
jgi:hypothetical protein